MKKGYGLLAVSAMISLFSACGNAENKEGHSTAGIESILPDSTKFIDTIDNKPTQLYILKNGNGLTAAITNYGGRVVSLVVPDKDGNPTDVVIGMDSPKAFAEASESYLGALIGRVGNRIAKGKFSIDGEEYSLFINNAPNS